jgi:hypothetical protein
MTKICKKCLQEKDIEQFYFRKDSHTYKHECIECCRNRNKKFHQENSEKIYERKKKHRQNNLEEFAEYQRGWRENNSEHNKEYNTNYRKTVLSPRNKQRRKTDPIYQATGTLRAQFTSWVKNRDYTKSCSIVNIIGCSLPEFLIYLGERIVNFDYDHILPLSKFNNVSQELVEKLLWNYQNFQYLDKKMNRYVKRDHLPIDWKERLTIIGNSLSVEVSEIIKTVESEILPHELFWDNDKKELRRL